MAEVAATIIAIVTFGAQITSQLYDIGAYINGIRADTDRVANNVSLYSDVLGLLADRFNFDAPIHSSRGLRLANKICAQSKRIFEDIHRRLPKTNADSSNSFPWIEKVRWYFRRKHVNALVAQLECLKSTASLLLNVLSMGKSIRRRRRRRGKYHNQPDPELQYHLINAQNSVVSYFDATEKLSTQEEAEDEDEDPKADVKLITGVPGHELLEQSVFQQPEMALVAREDSQALMSISNLLISEDTAMGKRQLVISRVDTMLSTLLYEWTNLNRDEDEYAEIVKACMTQLSERKLGPYPPNEIEATHAATNHLKTDPRDKNLSIYPGPTDTERRKWPASIVDDEMLTMGVKISGELDNRIFEILYGSETDPEKRFRIRGSWKPDADLLLGRLQESIRSTSQVLRNRYENGVRNGLSFEHLERLPSDHGKYSTKSHQYHEDSDDAEIPLNDASTGESGRSSRRYEPRRRSGSNNKRNTKLNEGIPKVDFTFGGLSDSERNDNAGEFNGRSNARGFWPVAEEEVSEETSESENDNMWFIGSSTKKKANVSTAKDKTEDTASVPLQKNRVIVTYVSITHEDQRHGTRAKIDMSRRRLDSETGKVISEDITLELPIRPGLKYGSKFKYTNMDLEGDAETGFRQIDWHFVIKTPLHTLRVMSDDFDLLFQPQVFKFAKYPPTDQEAREKYEDLREDLMDQYSCLFDIWLDGDKSREANSLSDGLWLKVNRALDALNKVHPRRTRTAPTRTRDVWDEDL